MTPRLYLTAMAFKSALEQRLREAAKFSAELGRKRQLLVFDRFLARLVALTGDTATLKGGLALEVRLGRARSTKDIDLRWTGSPEQVLETLQHAARRDLGDFMTFEVMPDEHHPTIKNEGLRYEGLRFKVKCGLAGKIYGSAFGVDVAFGDPIFGEPELVIAENFLAFAGIDASALRLYPIETHIAEKIHAYTMPRKHANSRLKDFPDLALLATARPLKARFLRQALKQTFEFRATHTIPTRLPNPPLNWTTPYAAMARDDELKWKTLGTLTRAVETFLGPVLADDSNATWDPRDWAWRKGEK